MNQLLSVCLLVLVMSACQSKSAKNETVTAPAPNAVSPIAPDQNLATERPDKNPAHGLPYHDCGIPVGAPLVAVKLPSQTNTPAQTDVQNPSSVPVKGAKLNPAHGQPGHRCDVQVGAPLP